MALKNPNPTVMRTTHSSVASRKQTVSSAADTANKRSRRSDRDKEEREDSEDGSEVEEEQQEEEEEEEEEEMLKRQPSCKSKLSEVAKGKLAAPASKGRLVPEVVLAPHSKQSSSSAAVSSTVDDDGASGIPVKKAKTLKYVTGH